jgi:hypothetical protein
MHCEGRIFLIRVHKSSPEIKITPKNAVKLQSNFPGQKSHQAGIINDGQRPLTCFSSKSPIFRICIQVQFQITNLISMFVKTPTQNETDIRSIRERSQLWSHTYA